MSKRLSSSREPYEIDGPALNLPRVRGVVEWAKDRESLHQVLARDVLEHGLNCVRRFGDFHMAFSGSPGLVPFCVHLMIDPICRGIPWRKSHLWTADELAVPLDDERSSWRRLRETIGDHSDIPRTQQHPMPAESPSVEAEYERELRGALEWRERGHDRLDFVLLELGGDGRVANLLPHSPAISERSRLIRRVASPDEPARLTMTYPLLNASRFIAVVVATPEAGLALERLANGSVSAAEFPAAGLGPVGGELRWYTLGEALPQSPTSA